MHELDGYTIHGSSRDIENEPMFFGFDLATANEFAGPLTRQFLDYIPVGWGDDVILDSRSHMLKPGWYPAIPGWHLDNVPRGEDGQPQLCECEAVHICCIVESATDPTGSLTEFVEHHCTPYLPDTLRDEDKARGYQSLWHLHNNLIEQADPPTMTVRSGRPVQFGCADYHRAMPAKYSGWRWFIRASHRSGRKVENKLRQQTQVYLTAPKAGW